MQSQLLVPSSTVVSDVNDWNKPSGNVVKEFSDKSNVCRLSNPVKVSAGMSDIPEDRRSISSSNGWLEKRPDGKAASRKSACRINLRSAGRPEKLEDVRGPMMPPVTINSSKDVKFDKELLAIPVTKLNLNIEHLAYKCAGLHGVDPCVSLCCFQLPLVLCFYTAKLCNRFTYRNNTKIIQF